MQTNEEGERTVVLLEDRQLLESLRQSGVAEHLHEGLVNYVNQYIQPGDFLMQVLSNDLRGAFERGDEESIASLRALVLWLYNEAPANCWGRPSVVTAWLARRNRQTG